jgi:hypothetical protein
MVEKGKEPSGWFLYRTRDKSMTPIEGRYFDHFMGATMYGYEIRRRGKRYEKWGLCVGCTPDIAATLPHK